MKIWQITIGTDKDGGNLETINGLAETADKAIEEAMAVATKDGYKKPYPALVTKIGEQVF